MGLASGRRAVVVLGTPGTVLGRPRVARDRVEHARSPGCYGGSRPGCLCGRDVMLPAGRLRVCPPPSGERCVASLPALGRLEKYSVRAERTRLHQAGFGTAGARAHMEES